MKVRPAAPADGLALQYRTRQALSFAPRRSRAHGLDERMRVQSLMEGREFLYQLTKMYAGGK